MRVAFMTFACPEWDLAEILGAAVELGYDGIEPRIDSNHKHGIEVDSDAATRALIRKQAAEAGVELCCLATSLLFNKVAPEARAQLHDDARRRIELAADLGMPGLRVFAGPLPEGSEKEAAFLAAAENLARAGDVARQHGVELWLETHDTICRAEDCAFIVDHANHPAVQINYDVMHPYRHGESVAETFAALGDHVRHTHFHDGPADPGKAVITKFGEGELPLVEILQRLKGIGFDGYLSGEWFNQQLGDTPRAALEHYLRGTRELVRRA